MRAPSRLFVLAILLCTPLARADEPTRFGVVDLSAAPAPDNLLATVEREWSRLRPGAEPIAEPAMKRMLATGEGPLEATTRLLGEARRANAAGDCARAITRAQEAEQLTLDAVALDDERDLLKGIYTLVVTCADTTLRTDERDRAARRLRALVSTPPDGLAADLWERVVKNAVPGDATVELFIDSDPPNAAVSINFHGEGGTPRTLKVAPGEVNIELQKDGYKKAFRRLTVGEAPARAVFRLIERARDRLVQAETALGTIRKDAPDDHPAALSRLAQLARVDTLLLVVAVPDAARVKLWFFDAERGAFGKNVIDSAYDPATGAIAALAARPTPAPSTVVAAPAPVSTNDRAPAPGPTATPTKAPDAALASLPEAETQAPAEHMLRRKSVAPPWWAWVIAAAIGVGIGTIIYLDQPSQRQTLDVHATWIDPTPHP